ncbi:MAG: alanine racemase [Nitrospirota bacterium]
MNRGAIAEINLSAIAHNLVTIKKSVKNRPIIAVVKADAYGHGSVEVSRRLIKEGASFLAVSYTGEAIELRDSGIDAPIIVLFDCEDIEGLFDFNLIPVIHRLATASSLSQLAKKRKTTIKVHIKVDTGMGRLGLWGDRIVEDLLSIADTEGIELVGMMSHFSDADLLDKSYAISQLERFRKIIDAVSRRLKRKVLSHMANSAAVIAFEDAYLDAVRPGLMLYGYSPFQESGDRGQKSPPLSPPLVRGGTRGGINSELRTPNSEFVNLIPAMKVKTRILCVRNLSPGSPVSYGRTFITKRHSKIGVIPVGYADGYNRIFSNNAGVLVKGKRVPVVGRVCMDLTMVDLTEVEDAREGDGVVLLGDQGKEVITAYELAERAKTIPYEILTSLGSRSRKEYIP